MDIHMEIGALTMSFVDQTMQPFEFEIAMKNLVITKIRIKFPGILRLWIIFPLDEKLNGWTSKAQALHVRKFLEGQGYDMGPVRVYQDNLTCMALVARGRSGSEKTRHIDIGYFWVKERVDEGEATIEHKGMEAMYANLLTKPLQWGQFEREREMLTGWQ